MSDDTPRLLLGQMADAQELDAMAINDALIQLDAFTDICLLGQFVNTPPSSPADGDMYLLGASPTGGWSGQAYKLAYCIDGGWRFYAPFDGLRAFVAGSNGFLVYHGGQWLDCSALISANEVSIASAATCDVGAAGSLCVQVTGAATITSFGAGANLVRLVHFAGALTLTYNATSLILPGAANITTAAGDAAIFVSDGSGHWRCQSYQRANGVPLNVSSVTGAGRMVLNLGPTVNGLADTGVTVLAKLGIGMTPSNILDIAQNQNGPSLVQLQNTSGGNVAYSGLQISNSGSGTNSGIFAQFGSGNTFGGINRPNGTYVASRGAGGLTLNTEISAQPIYFAVNSAETARFGSDGSLLVGTTTNGGWTGGAKLEAKTVGGTGVSGYATGPGYALAARIDNTSGHLVDLNYNGSGVGCITTNGSATSYNTSSDARLKTVAAQQGHYRDAIRDLWIGDFTWKDGGAPGFGVLAQQAYEVMPHHAGVTKPAQQDDAWHASAEPFAFLALWGVKDLYGLVASLAARIAALEAAHA